VSKQEERLEKDKKERERRKQNQEKWEIQWGAVARSQEGGEGHRDVGLKKRGSKKAEGKKRHRSTVTPLGLKGKRAKG